MNIQEKNMIRERIIQEGLRKGWSANRILMEFKDRSVGAYRNKWLKIIKERKQEYDELYPSIEILEEMVILNKLLTRKFYEDEYTEEEVVEIDVKVSDIYRRIEEYVFEEHSKYDEVILDVEKVRKDRKLEKKRLTFGKLKCIFHIIFEKDEKGVFEFQRLRYQEIMDIVNMLWRLFRQKTVIKRVKNFNTISKIREIMLKKEVAF